MNYIGIDIGSTCAKTVVLNKKKRNYPGIRSANRMEQRRYSRGNPSKT